MEKNEFNKKVDTFIFRLNCDLADHTNKLEIAKDKKNIFDFDKEEAFIKYISKLIIKAKTDLSCE